LRKKTDPLLSAERRLEDFRVMTELGETEPAEQQKSVQQELEQSFRTSPVAQRGEAERDKIVRFRLKPDVRRGDCRAVRLEVGGPEGFMIGFDQFKTGSCKTDEAQSEAHH